MEPGTTPAPSSPWPLRLGLQILYLTPLFWFFEAAQNCAFKAVQGHWGWVFPAEGRWFSFTSLALWAVAVAVFFAFDELWFNRRRTSWWRRAVVAGTPMCFIEWTCGYVGTAIGHPAQVWPGTVLKFVGLAALPLWWLDQIVYRWLAERLPRISG